jgi:ABC-type Na+ transport system ATPase subunit NatA
MIRADNLWKKFGRHEALRGLSFSVPEGSAYALIGANGAGKTTAIRILMNILEAERGNAAILSVDSRRISPRELAQIGYVSENQDIPKALTVAEYLDYLRPFYPRWDKSLEASALRELRLPRECRIGDLSHGMRMKAALACALPFRPKLLVLRIAIAIGSVTLRPPLSYGQTVAPRPEFEVASIKLDGSCGNRAARGGARTRFLRAGRWNPWLSTTLEKPSEN